MLPSPPSWPGARGSLALRSSELEAVHKDSPVPAQWPLRFQAQQGRGAPGPYSLFSALTLSLFPSVFASDFPPPRCPCPPRSIPHFHLELTLNTRSSSSMSERAPPPSTPLPGSLFFLALIGGRNHTHGSTPILSFNFHSFSVLWSTTVQ